MKRRTLFILLSLSLLVAGLVMSGDNTLAQSGGGYDLSWSTVDNGGTMFSTGGGYSLGGTIGQLDAGALSGEGYALTGGVWARGISGGQIRLFLPAVIK
jgi:hypothetical protein